MAVFCSSCGPAVPLARGLLAVSGNVVWLVFVRLPELRLAWYRVGSTAGCGLCFGPFLGPAVPPASSVALSCGGAENPTW